VEEVFFVSGNAGSLDRVYCGQEKTQPARWKRGQKVIAFCKSSFLQLYRVQRSGLVFPADKHRVL